MSSTSSPVTTASQPPSAQSGQSGGSKNTPRLRTRRKHTPGRPKRSVLLTVLTGLIMLYTVVPLVWLVISATKTQEGLANSSGLWFSHDFALWDNISKTFTYHDGIFVRWLLNTLLYVGLGAAARPSWRSWAATRWRSSPSPGSAPSSPWSSVPSPSRAPPWRYPPS